MSLLVWDIYLCAFVLFPLLFGGVWVAGSDRLYGLVNVAGPTIGALVLAALLKGYWGRSLEESRVSRALIRAWETWVEKAQTRKGLLTATFLVGTLWGVTAIARHRSFHSYAFDLGIFTNAIWSLSSGNGYVSSVKDGMNLLADHVSPLFLLFAPLFKLLPYPETLLVAQSFALASAGAVTYRLARQYVASPGWAAIVPLLFWTYQPIRNANLFDFHPEILMLPLFLGAIAGLNSSSTTSRVLGASAFLLALGAKETAPPVGAGIGLAWMLGAGPLSTRAWTRKVGAAVSILSLCVFYVDIAVVPNLVGKQYVYQVMYRELGTSWLDVVLAPLLHPILFFQKLAGAARLRFLWKTLAPLAFLPLLNWRALPAAIPGYLILFLSEGDSRVATHFHYAVECSVGLFFALPGGLERARALLLQKHHAALAGAVLVCALCFLGRSEAFHLRFFQGDDHTRWLARDVIPAVSPDARIAASDSLVPHLSTRSWVHNLTSLKSADCVLVDTSLRNDMVSAGERQSIVDKLPKLGFSSTLRCGTFTAYEKSPCFTKKILCPRE